MRVKEAVIGITSMWQQQALCDSQVSASVWQRVPWVRVLDAYDIARLRVDAHPEYGDCTHYCLPGVPDVWNGRMLSTRSCFGY